MRSAIHDSQQPASPIRFLFLKLPPPPCSVLLAIEAARRPDFGVNFLDHVWRRFFLEIFRCAVFLLIGAEISQVELLPRFMRQCLCQRTDKALCEGSGFCCEFWTPLWGLLVQDFLSR